MTVITLNITRKQLNRFLKIVDIESDLNKCKNIKLKIK